MKINVFAFLLLILSVGKTMAQTVLESNGLAANTTDIRFAAKVGFNIADIHGKEITGNKFLFGVHFGGMAEIPVMDQFYFQPEALISLQGARGDSENLNLTYLAFPLMGKYDITPEISAEFGPQIGVLLGDSSENFGNVNTKILDFGLNFGGGYRLNDNFYFQLRYVLGLTNVMQGVKAKNGVFQFGACYFFN